MTARDDTLEQLRHQFETGSVWNDRDSIDPHDALLRLLIKDEMFRAAVARAIPTLLASSDLRHRTGAVALLSELGSDLGADAMTSWVTANNASLRDVRAAWRIQHEDLETCAAVAIAKAARPADRIAIAWLKQIATDRPWRTYVLDALARLDPEWLIANARALVTHDHLGLFEVLDPSRQDRLVDALSPYPPEKPTVLTEAFWRRLPAATAERLRGRMWPSITLSPPPKIDFVAREIRVRLAYCGAAWSGRSTSLVRVHDQLAESLRTPVVARAGPVDVRVGFSFVVPDRARNTLKVRVELSTTPSARHHGAVALVPLLDGVHGIIYVLDDDPARRDAATDYRRWLDTELANRGCALSQVPHVWQVNQRGLPEAMSVVEVCRGIASDDAPVIAGNALADSSPRAAVDALLDLVLGAHELLEPRAR